MIAFLCTFAVISGPGAGWYPVDTLPIFTCSLLAPCSSHQLRFVSSLSPLHLSACFSWHSRALSFLSVSFCLTFACICQMSMLNVMLQYFCLAICQLIVILPSKLFPFTFLGKFLLYLKHMKTEFPPKCGTLKAYVCNK